VEKHSNLKNKMAPETILKITQRYEGGGEGKKKKKKKTSSSPAVLVTQTDTKNKGLPAVEVQEGTSGARGSRDQELQKKDCK